MPPRPEQTDKRAADTLLDGYLVLRGNDSTLAWYADAPRVDQVTGDSVYRAARGRQSDLPWGRAGHRPLDAILHPG